MKNTTILVYALIVLTMLSCSSAEDCTKTIIIPSVTVTSPTGISFIPEYQAQVPCDYVQTPIQELTPLQNFSFEVLNFTFTSNTGNNTSRLKFDIKLNNLNSFTINGYAIMTVNADGTVSSGGFTNGSSSSCTEIVANSSCVFSYDKESPLEEGLISSIQLVDVKYYLVD
jgi:hypothetical protein